MITDSFNKSQGKISPEMIYGPGKKITDTCLVTFSHKLINLIVDTLKPEVIATIKSTNCSIPIYLLVYKGKKIAIYNSYIGSALAGTCMINASHFTGAEKFIMFGSAGRL